MTIERWTTLMKAMGLEENRETYSKLIDAHAEKHRRYHTAVHVQACLEHLDRVEAMVERPLELELAFWFHDAIYKPFSSDNELDSARWAVAFMKENGLCCGTIERVDDLIMATCHTATDLVGDKAYMVDIDLTILGASTAHYDEFEEAIRFEYKRVPKFLYRKKRKEILQSFVDRETIYLNDVFRYTFEAPARENLARAIAAL